MYCACYCYSHEDPFKYVITWENIAERELFFVILQFLEKTIKRKKKEKKEHRSVSGERNEIRRLYGEQLTMQKFIRGAQSSSSAFFIQIIEF